MVDVKEQVNRVGLAFTRSGLVFDHVDEERPRIEIAFGGGDFSYSNVTIHVVFDGDGESVQLITSPIASVPVERLAGFLCTLNEVNKRFRWIKFYLDDDNDLVATADMLFDEMNTGDACLEVTLRMANIINDAYPDLMRAIWG